MTQEVKLDDLYQEVILDHNRRPRNFGKIDDATHYAHGVNPLCGDDYHVYLKIGANGRIDRVAFEGSGCAISKSSASLMTTFLEGKTVDEAVNLHGHFVGFMTRDGVSPQTRAAVGRLKIFEGVKHFPARVKCATLAWQALKEALK